MLVLLMEPLLQCLSLWPQIFNCKFQMLLCMGGVRGRNMLRNCVCIFVNLRANRLCLDGASSYNFAYYPNNSKGRTLQNNDLPLTIHLRVGADKSLARPGRKQATATKLGIYSTCSPRSSKHFLALCSNFCKPLKKNSEGCPSNKVSTAANDLHVG